jgi:hypothetical protein
LAITKDYIFEVRSFHGLASFYQKFIKNFSRISEKMMDTVKKRHKYFHWTTEAERSFKSVETEDHGTTGFGVARFSENISGEM